ncbi:hypothetical protein P7C70_g1977, partial [Phenoliferia sp. Uapishka_3]
MVSVSLVCRAWREPAQYILFTNVQIPNYSWCVNDWGAEDKTRRRDKHWDTFAATRLYPPLRVLFIGRENVRGGGCGELWYRSKELGWIGGVQRLILEDTRYDIGFLADPKLRDLRHLELNGSVLVRIPQFSLLGSFPSLASIVFTNPSTFPFDGRTPFDTLVQTLEWLSGLFPSANSISLDFSKLDSRSKILPGAKEKRVASLIRAQIKPACQLSIHVNLGIWLEHNLPAINFILDLQPTALFVVKERQASLAIEDITALFDTLPPSITFLSIPQLSHSHFDLMDIVSSSLDKLPPHLKTLRLPDCRRSELSSEMNLVVAECEGREIRLECWEDLLLTCFSSQNKMCSQCFSCRAANGYRVHRISFGDVCEGAKSLTV